MFRLLLGLLLALTVSIQSFGGDKILCSKVWSDTKDNDAFSVELKKSAARSGVELQVPSDSNQHLVELGQIQSDVGEQALRLPRSNSNGGGDSSSSILSPYKWIKKSLLTLVSGKYASDVLITDRWHLGSDVNKTALKTSTIETVREQYEEFSKEKQSSNRELSIFYSFVGEMIHLVLDQYANRRNWPTEFLNKIRSDAFAYASRSIFFTVRKLAQPSRWIDGDLLGALKLISATPKQQLPVERFLQIQLPRNGGMVFEPSNFVIRQKGVNVELRQIVLSELMASYVMHAKRLLQRPEHEPNKYVYFTYGDEKSVMMYSRMGFEVPKEFSQPFVLTNSDGSVMLDDKGQSSKWWVLAATAETISKMQDVMLEHRADVHASIVGQINKRSEYLAKTRESDPDVQEYLFRSMFRNFKSNPYVFDLAVSISRTHNDADGSYRVIDLDGQIEQLQNLVTIDTSNLPLKPGMFLSKEGYSVVYTDKNVLWVMGTKNGVDFTYMIDVDPDLSKLSKILINTKTKGVSMDEAVDPNRYILSSDPIEWYR